MAATLAAGPDALLSHYPAAVLWRFRPPREGPMEVTIAGGDRRSRPGLRIHRSTLQPADVTRHNGVPVTSPARTLLDLAATAPPSELDRALNEARLRRRISAHSLKEQFSRYPRHRGIAALTQATRAGPSLTRSEAERLALDLIRRARLPTPATNVILHGYEVDLAWREAKVVVEIDGYAFHSSRHAFEHDRRRDQALTGEGWLVMRVTWRQLTGEREAVVAAITRALAERR